ncbi:PIN domain-containing protein [Mesorhizobium sp.]|uniref:PIN domain-containing protein n=1 Tax=Mesorhizobium sp. TaxID=1871066 RepID=UPI00344E1645
MAHSRSRRKQSRSDHRLYAGLYVVPLDTEIALAAAEACRKHKLATADAIIFATARAHDATLLTCDKHFESLPVVTLIEKI